MSKLTKLASSYGLSVESNGSILVQYTSTSYFIADNLCNELSNNTNLHFKWLYVFSLVGTVVKIKRKHLSVLQYISMVIHFNASLRSVHCKATRAITKTYANTTYSNQRIWKWKYGCMLNLSKNEKTIKIPKWNVDNLQRTDSCFQL